MRTRTTVVLAFFRFLEERQIRYAVVGDVRGFPNAVRHDVDIIVDQAVTAIVPMEVCAFCDRHDLRLTQCSEHEQNARCFVVSWSNTEDKLEFLAIDICGDYYRNGRKLLSAIDILATRQQAVDVKGRELGFSIPSPAVGFTYYLLRCIDNTTLEERHSNYLFEQWQRNPLAAAIHIRALWGNTPEARMLIKASEADDWSVVRCILPRLRRTMRKRRALTLRAWYCELRRRLRRELQPQGLMVAVLGADDSGKSSALQLAASMVEPLFSNQRTFYIHPRVIFSSNTQQPKDNSSPTAAREKPASLSTFLLLIADYAFGYWYQLRPLLVRSTLVIFDRYYEDLQVEPSRSRPDAQKALLHAMHRFVPKPDLYVVLDTPTDAPLAINRELEIAESVRHHTAYLALASGRRLVAVDATHSVQRTAASIAMAITECAAKRTAIYMEKFLAPRVNPRAARWLLFVSRHRVPILSKLSRIVFNSDIDALVPRDVLLPHPYGIVIEPKTLVGHRVTIMQQVTLGEKNQGAGAPTIDDGVYIGAGAKILGAVHIGVGAIIGANAVVTQNIPAHATVVGVNRIVGRPADIATIENYLRDETIVHPEFLTPDNTAVVELAR
ncbi:MAG: hypothetical protein H7Y02_08640 [Candidatus Obscuribacterales bacterium]|nr:hypothetical protein [Steroidobacteraceae bacterium]